MRKLFALLTIALMFSASASFACTNFIVTKGASNDGSAFLSYAADSHVLYGELYYRPAADYQPGTMMKIYNWDSGQYLGDIPQVLHTYNVVGNVNEHQLAIGETTYGGREELWEGDGIIDYGSLIYLALQRAKNAREAIKVMTELMSKYGYVSEGESFSIVDKDEAWILEVIGKGKGQKGAVWVARMIPDGYVSAHANQARITTFPQATKKSKDVVTFKNIDKLLTDKNITCVYSDDVITFAREKGYFKGNDADFSFSDTYAPVDFSGARFCEIRVWAFFNDVAEGMDQYWEYAKGTKIEYDGNGYATNRMPLWVKPAKPVTLETVMHNMGNHLEGTELDMSKGMGAGPFNCPYRWRPMTWEYNGKNYIHERATGTQQTGFSFVAQLRGNLPDVLGAINWFGVDDCATTVYVPMYASITEIPYAYREGNGSMMKFKPDAAFWIFNLVSNFAYTRYCDIYPEIETVRRDLHRSFKDETAKIEGDLREEAANNPQNVAKKLTEYSAKASENTMQTWQNLFASLFVKYVDGNIKTEREVPEGYKYYSPEVKQPKYGNDWYKHIVEDDTKHLLEAK